MKLLLLLAVLGQEPASPTFLVSGLLTGFAGQGPASPTFQAWGLLAAFAGQDNEDHAKLLSAKADREKIASGDVVTLKFEIAIDPGWHIYPTKKQSGTLETTFTFDGDVAIAGAIKEPKTKRHSETFADGTKFEYDYIEESPAVFEVPVRVHGKPGPAAIKGKIKGQTCTDVCMDMVLDFSVAVTIEADDKPRVRVVSVTPAKEKARNGEAVKVEFALEIPKGWYIYPFTKKRGVGKPTVLELSGAALKGAVEEPAPKPHDDANPELAYDYHEGALKVVAPIALKGTKEGDKVEVKGTLVYQICGGPEGVCMDGTAPFSFTVTSLGGEDIDTDSEYESRGFLGLILLGILGGLISLVMPCTYPLIPITLTYFVKQGAGSRAHGLLLSTLYSLGIILSFTGIGFALSIFLGPGGAREFASNPWVSIVVGILFLWFTGSLFGWYEIKLPFGLDQKFAGGQRKGAGGAFILGLLFSLVTFTCTIPIAATILTVAAGQHRLAALLAMLAYSTTMAVPFFLMGLFPGMIKEIPKSGGWLTTVKVSMGFVELLLAFVYFAKADQTWEFGYMPRWFIVGAWVLTCLVIALYLFRFFRARPTIVRSVFALLFLGLGGYMGYFGFRYPNQPMLGIMEIMVPQPPIHGTTMPAALAEAKAKNLPLFVEFTGIN